MTSPFKKCPSRKFRYTSESAANNQLALLREKAKREKQEKGRTRRREQSSYACPDCDGWHLTSKSRSPARPLDRIVADVAPALHPNALDEIE